VKFNTVFVRWSFEDQRWVQENGGQFTTHGEVRRLCKGVWEDTPLRVYKLTNSGELQLIYEQNIIQESVF